MNREEIINTIKSVIEKDEKLGEQAGGSGHLSFVSYNLDEFSELIKVEKGFMINYKYSVYIESEFSLEPYQYIYKKSIVINKPGEIIFESDKELIPGNNFPIDFDDELILPDDD